MYRLPLKGKMSPPRFVGQVIVPFQDENVLLVVSSDCKYQVNAGLRMGVQDIMRRVLHTDEAKDCPDKEMMAGT